MSLHDVFYTDLVEKRSARVEGICSSSAPKAVS